MKKKVKQNYIKNIEKVRKEVKGFPLSLALIERRRYHHDDEIKWYKALKKEAYSKKGRSSGLYEIFLGIDTKTPLGSK